MGLDRHLIVVVTGGREYQAWRVVDDTFAVLARGEWEHRTLVHGAARGADTLAARAGLRHGFEVLAFPASWDLHGRRAGFMRNEMMARRALASREMGKRVVVVHFPGGRGTEHMVTFSRGLGLEVLAAADVIEAGGLTDSALV